MYLQPNLTNLGYFFNTDIWTGFCIFVYIPYLNEKKDKGISES